MVITRRTFVAGVTVVLAAVMTVAVRTETTIGELRQQQYDTCLSRVANIQRGNDSALQFIAIERANTVAAPETIAARIAAYEASLRDVPVCPPKP